MTACEDQRLINCLLTGSAHMHAFGVVVIAMSSTSAEGERTVESGGRKLTRWVHGPWEYLAWLNKGTWHDGWKSKQLHPRAEFCQLLFRTMRNHPSQALFLVLLVFATSCWTSCVLCYRKVIKEEHRRIMGTSQRAIAAPPRHWRLQCDGCWQSGAVWAGEPSGMAWSSGWTFCTETHTKLELWTYYY